MTTTAIKSVTLHSWKRGVKTLAEDSSLRSQVYITDGIKRTLSSKRFETTLMQKHICHSFSPSNQVYTHPVFNFQLPQKGKKKHHTWICTPGYHPWNSRKANPSNSIERTQWVCVYSIKKDYSITKTDWV